LLVISREFVERYRSAGGRKESWFLWIGACSHWWRPHQRRWTAAGGFAWPTGYKGVAGYSDGLPEFDWSVILSFDGERWKRIDKFSGKKQAILRVAVPARTGGSVLLHLTKKSMDEFSEKRTCRGLASRTARHKQAAIHSVWSTSRQPEFYGFRVVGEAIH